MSVLGTGSNVMEELRKAAMKVKQATAKPQAVSASQSALERVLIWGLCIEGHTLHRLHRGCHQTRCDLCSFRSGQNQFQDCIFLNTLS